MCVAVVAWHEFMRVRRMRTRRLLTCGVFAGLLAVGLSPLPASASGGGELDPTFGAGGKVLTDLGGLDVARAVGIQADGKIVLAGSSSGDQGTDVALARYDRDGTLDATFGSGGRV